MERKGVYRKGSAGHVRNVNTYRLLQEKYKKWRGPFMGAIVLVMVFGLSPMNGQQLQTSILTSESTTQLIEQDPAAARKTILEYAAGIAKECEAYGMTACKQEGDLLQGDLANEAIDTRTVFNAVVHYEEKTLAERAKNSCKYEAAKYVNDLRDAQSKLSGFSESYAEVLTSVPTLANEVAALKNQVAKVKQLVDSCGE